jgi:uncharacterized protein (TIGR03083 family)
MADLWGLIHQERRALASDLGNLTTEQWESPSLCSEWTVRQALAHLTATAKISTGTFFPKLIGSGFSLTRMQARDIAAEQGSSGADALARFDEVVDFSKSPPGPQPTWLGEVVVHGEDIRRPLGITHSYPVDTIEPVASFYVGSNLIIGAKKRVAGLTLRATDADWTHGDGPEVSGPIVSLVLAMTGRKAAIDDLAGEGVQTLRSR